METDEILRNITTLSRARRQCTYYLVDLHVHSPASYDYRGENDISPYQFVSQFAERGHDLIAITDHNTGAYIDKAIEASGQIAEKGGRKVTILPGVELSVSPGVHLLAILGNGGSAAISALLSRLELPDELDGDFTKPIMLSIGEIAQIVHNRGGLLIGAHCNSTHGVVDELRGQHRMEWLRLLDALEIRSGQVEEKVSKTITYVKNALGVSIPFTFGSDSHDATSCTSGMWVKMADPSFASLRQLTFEPELRVSRTEPNAPTHGRVVGFTTTHGIYAGGRFRFSPNLNVLLGGRGAGKSAAIDLLRFALEAEPRLGDENYEVFANRIMGFLQSIGEVLVVVVGTDGQTYVITRSGGYDKPNRRASPTFSDSARVFQVVDGNLILRELRPQDVLGTEFYGQGEAARLADRVGEQMRLIDENLDLSSFDAAVAEAERELIDDENQMIELKRRVEKLQVEAVARPQLEERRDRLAKTLDDPVFDDRKRWDSERVWVQGRQDWAQTVSDNLPRSMPSRTEIPIDIENSSAKSVLEKVRNASDRLLESGGGDLLRLHEEVAGVVSELEAYRTEWNREFETADSLYRTRLADLGATDLAQAAAEQRGVEQKLVHIATTVEPEIGRMKGEIIVLEVRRAKLLEKLRTSRSAMSTLRAEFVEELNSRLGGSVMVSLSGVDHSLYFEAVDSPLRGSGMHNREDQVSRVCDSFSPEELVEIVRAASVDRLTAIGITDNSANLMMKNLSGADLYNIERVDVPPLPSIRIKREGETQFTDLSSLSVGEKCSAILSIALLSKGKPLVIDQPEDDLDHAFIIDSIVEGIRKAKSDRQIIAATHNPNIPVLGDAEMVFRVARRAGKDVCRIQNAGGLELPQVTEEVQSLEGGAEAFERRRQRYSGIV